MALEQKALVISSIPILGEAAATLNALPLLKFIGLGCVGGLAGSFLAQEKGLLDTLSRRDKVCFFSRRIVLGACIGVMVFVGWAGDSEYANLWMLGVCVISTSPIEMSKKIIELAQGFLAKKGEK